MSHGFNIVWVTLSFKRSEYFLIVLVQADKCLKQDSGYLKILHHVLAKSSAYGAGMTMKCAHNGLT